MSELFLITATQGLVSGFLIGFIAYFIGFAMSRSLHLFDL